jgi:hypothetical protein
MEHLIIALVFGPALFFGIVYLIVIYLRLLEIWKSDK